MQLQVYETFEQLSRAAADVLLKTVVDNPAAVIIVATGSTPTLAYQLWVQDLITQKVDFSQMTIIKLDEWGGLPMNHPNSCEHYIREYILDPLKLRPSQYVGFNSQPVDPFTDCLRIDAALRRFPVIDCCILGIGVNGHLGFNEPSTTWSTGPFVATLADSTLRHPMLNDGRNLVQFGLTLGIGNIKTAKNIVALAAGENKADIIATALRGPVTPECPASILQQLDQANIFLDRAAAQKI